MARRTTSALTLCGPYAHPFRYARHYNLTWCVDYPHESLQRIFETILKWHLASFSGDCSALYKPIVAATIDIYGTIAAELLPTPAKSHYTYNLRDISKVVQGVLQCDVRSVSSGAELTRLWLHECCRVFADRLVTDDDALWFHRLLDTQLEARFKKEWKGVVGSAERRLLYGDLMADDGQYRHMPEMGALIERMEAMLEDYNAVSKRPMELVLFPFAVEHVTRILRIIKQPFGNALLVGVGGSGRQSLTRLASYIASFKVCF